MAPSTYYATKSGSPSARACRDAIVGPALRELWEDNYRVYGARKRHVGAMSTLHMNHYREQYRNELTPKALAWLFFNMAVATTMRYIEADDPIRLEELRSGLKFASSGLLAGGRD